MNTAAAVQTTTASLHQLELRDMWQHPSFDSEKQPTRKSFFNLGRKAAHSHSCPRLSFSTDEAVPALLPDTASRC
jgi:hypothetical protein